MKLIAAVLIAAIFTSLTNSVCDQPLPEGYKLVRFSRGYCVVNVISKKYYTDSTVYHTTVDFKKASFFLDSCSAKAAVRRMGVKPKIK